MGTVVTGQWAWNVGVRAQRGVHTGPGSDIAYVRQGGHPLCRSGAERGQSTDASAGQIMTRSGLDLGDPQRGPVRCGQELHVPGEALGLARVPGVIAVVIGTGDTITVDEGAVQGLELFRSYYTANEERAKSLAGGTPLALLALACLAYDTAEVDPNFRFEVESGYLPKHLVQRSWYGEFPT